MLNLTKLACRPRDTMSAAGTLMRPRNRLVMGPRTAWTECRERERVCRSARIGHGGERVCSGVIAV